MKRFTHSKMVSFVDDVLVLIDVLVLRGLRGIIIMQMCLCVDNGELNRTLTDELDIIGLVRFNC